MSKDLSWARGPLSFDEGGEVKESEVQTKARNAEYQTIAQLIQHGFNIEAASGAADIVALDQNSKEIRIEVKTASPPRKNKRVFVTDPAAEVDAHVFVAFDEHKNPDFWVVPSAVVADKGTRTGVIQESDVSAYHNNWEALAQLPGSS